MSRMPWEIYHRWAHTMFGRWYGDRFFHHGIRIRLGDTTDIDWLLEVVDSGYYSDHEQVRRYGHSVQMFDTQD